MTIRTEFPHTFTEIQHQWIPLSDGARLSARIWLPDDAAETPVPAVLEYVPYRKDDMYARQDSTRHRYFAGFGYAAVRVDLRGSGDSDGVLLGEYLRQEHDDALEVIAWLAEQPWCSGAVGMIGYSWGGFNGLQIAARRPPALKAVISLHSTDDRYLDDCHYQGGVLLGSDMLKWATWMRAYTAVPADPRFVEDWREGWLERLERTPHYIEDWVLHQLRDAFWKHGSIAEDYSAVEAAVLLGGGWADSYTNAVPRMLENLTCPRAGIIGPWAHAFPEQAMPGPRIGFLQECVSWWDRWLKGIDNGADRLPLLRAWMQESAPPSRDHSERPGRWVTARTWPPHDVSARAFELSADGSLAEPGQGVEGVREIGSDTWCGAAAGVWCPSGNDAEMPDDQRDEDARSLCFDTAPLVERVEVLGRPRVVLTLSADAELATVAVRLCDVAPDGTSALLTWNQANLAHDSAHETVVPVTPGEPMRVEIDLNVIGQAVEAGHRLRLAVSPMYWPHAWPSPTPVTLAVHAGAKSTLTLPVFSEEGGEAAVVFGEPETAEPLAYAEGPVGSRTRVVTRDEPSGLQVIEDREMHEGRIAESGTRHLEAAVDRYEIVAGDPLSARVHCERKFELEREGWDVRVVVSSEMWCDAANFYVLDVLEAYDEGEQIFQHHRTLEIPRQGG